MNTEHNKEQIKTLWMSLPSDGTKSEFINACAKKFKRANKTIRNYWFTKWGDWSVPVKFQAEVISDLKKETKKHLPISSD